MATNVNEIREILEDSELGAMQAVKTVANRVGVRGADGYPQLRKAMLAMLDLVGSNCIDE